MRLRLIITDKEYGTAFANAIGKSEFDVFLEMGSVSTLNVNDDRTIIVTDIDYRRLDRNQLDQYKDRIIFLTSDREDYLIINGKDPYCIFKYRSISNILSDIAQVNYLLTGETLMTTEKYTTICVCSNFTGLSGSVSRALARQILFRKGLNTLVLSLNFINDFGTEEEQDNRKYSRLMYYMDLSKDFAVEGFTYRDSYGISYLSLPTGLNPLAYMSYENLNRLIKCLCKGHYDILILNIGTCYTENNIRIMNAADNMLFLSEDDSRFAVSELLDTPDLNDRVYRIYKGISGENVELRIDDYVMKLFNIEEGDVNVYEHK